MAEASCIVCTHPQAEEIDAALRDGVPIGELGPVYGLKIKAISDHRRLGHVPGFVTWEEWSLGGDDLEKDILYHQMRYQSIAVRAKSQPKGRGLAVELSATRASQACTEKLVELRRRFAPEVSRDEMNAFRQKVLAVLKRHPDAYQAVVRALTRPDPPALPANGHDIEAAS